ncbi:hypothetical protein Bbelb_161020 [Branchiostoma belcheri]|nr:hypothetical protein Bbelb_161020 [Branchiostoma belcheri]
MLTESGAETGSVGDLESEESDKVELIRQSFPQKENNKTVEGASSNLWENPADRRRNNMACLEKWRRKTISSPVPLASFSSSGYPSYFGSTENLAAASTLRSSASRLPRYPTPHYYLYNTEVNPLQDRPPMSRASMEYYASVLNNKPDELPTDEAATAQASNEVAPKVAEGAVAKVAEETAKVAEGTANVTEGTTSEVETKIEDTVEKDKEEESEVEAAIGDFRRRRKFTTAKAIETAVGENTPRLITVTPEESQAIREFLSSVSSLTPPPSPAGPVSPAQDGTTEPGKPGESATQPQQTTAQTAQETMGILQDEEDDIVVLGPTERKFEKNGNESITGYLRKATTTGSDVTNMDADTSAAVLQINHKPIRGILRRSSSEGSTGTSHGRRVRFSIEEDYKENERDSDMETELGDVEVDDAEAMGFSFLGHD